LSIRDKSPWAIRF